MGPRCHGATFWFFPSTVWVIGSKLQFVSKWIYLLRHLSDLVRHFDARISTKKTLLIKMYHTFKIK